VPETTVRPYSFYADTEVLDELADVRRQLTGNLTGAEHDSLVSDLVDKKQALELEGATRGLEDPETGMPFQFDDEDPESWN
jgi:hypothetical protein